MTSVKDESAMVTLGEAIGKRLRGGEVLELVGDVGAGKTTLVKGIGRGLQVTDDVQSPSFTISRVYEARDGLALHHYDFYRLQEAGVMRYELSESIETPEAVTVIEWADTVQQVLPERYCRIDIRYVPDGEGREVTFAVPDALQYVTEGL
jgi:tRNA threonylcarbamoyladenosine biosynthesis protein TsaE